MISNMAFIPSATVPSLRTSSSTSFTHQRSTSCVTPASRRSSRHVVAPICASADPSSKALIFDCDGVLVETEELHRLSYNECWAENNLGFEWDYDLYEKLQNSIGGGKEKMRWYFDTYDCWPETASTPETRADLLAHLHTRKTVLYQDLIRAGRATVRPGVLRLIDEAHAAGLNTAICSAANKIAVMTVLQQLLGEERLSRFNFVLAGDDVKEKKPSPAIYEKACEKLAVPKEGCVVVEDTQIGLKAAVGAGLRCIITYTSYTATQEFEGASEIYPSLGEVGADSEDSIITIARLFPDLAPQTVAP